MADDSLDLDEDYKELGKGSGNMNNNEDILNQPQDFSLDGSNDKPANSLLDSQHDVNKAMFIQSSIDKLPGSKKDIVEPRFVLAEIEEIHVDHEKNENFEVKEPKEAKEERVKLEGGETNSNKTCGICDASCILI